MLTDETEIDGSPFVVTAKTRVDDGTLIGGRYELRAAVGVDGSFVAERSRAR